MSEIFNIIRSIDDFAAWWENESDGTRKIYAALTDASLKQPIGGDHRTLGRIAWHIVQSIPELSGHVGLNVVGPKETEPVPASAATVQKAYGETSRSFLTEVKKNWNDDTLKIVDNMYGYQWTRSFTLAVLVHHEIHHRAQMTILMRQAGLKVPGIYGPALEEWANYGGQPPAI